MVGSSSASARGDASMTEEEKIGSGGSGKDNGARSRGRGGRR